MSLLELFCDVDDFMLDFEPHWKASQLQAGGKQRERAGHPFDLVFGRKTYEIFAPYWPYQNIDENPSAASLNVAKKPWRQKHRLRGCDRLGK